jgi:hypothetical protein
MQKIQSYLYPNRIILLADLAGFTTENKIVYARTVKIYKGVDNVIEFDIQNADQKRLELVTSPSITNLEVNVMDQSGKALTNSPYTISPSVTIKGISSVTIPAADLEDLLPQSLKYTVTATDASGNTIPLYADSRFGAVGTIELVASAMPTTRSAVVYDRFSGEINFMGNVINHSSAIPVKFYEAIATTSVTITCVMTGFIGDLYVEGTEDSTISVESFRNATRIQTFSTTVGTTTTHTFTKVPVGSYNFLRVSWQYPNISPFNTPTTNPYGTVDKITVTS